MSGFLQKERKKSDPFAAPAPDASAAARRASPPAPPKPPVAAAGSKSSDIDYAQPWADEVGGVPTGAVARDDDDDMIVSTDVTERSRKVEDGGVTATTTRRTSEGGKTKTSSDELHAGYADGSVAMSETQSDETRYSEGVARKQSHSRGMDVSLDGGHLTSGSSVETTSGGRKQTRSVEGKIGVVDGKLDAERKRTTRMETANGAREDSSSWGISDGKMTRGQGHTEEKTRRVIEKGDDGKYHEVEKKSSQGSETTFAVGPDGASAGKSWTTKREDGSTSTTDAGVDADFESGNYGAHASHTYKTASGKYVTASVNAGVTVECSEPEQVGDHWVVSYKRSKNFGGSMGGGGDHVGVNAGATASGFENGQRSFKTPEEAKAFKEHAAERVREIADPRSVAGALSMEIGESRGKGNALEGSLGASVSLEGATLGAQASKKSSDEVDVRRVSANVFEVTYLEQSDKDGKLTLSGGPATAYAGQSSDKHHAVTVAFDLSTVEGQKAFEQYCRDHKVPKQGGKLVSTEDGRGENTYDGMTFWGGFKNEFGHHTWENEVIDDEGDHETYGGEETHRVTKGRLGSWLGDKDVHSSVGIVARQEDQKEDGYSIVANYGGESGAYNRGRMARMMEDRTRGGEWDLSYINDEETFDEGKVDGHASGEWTMSADISKQMVHDFERYRPEMFKGKSEDDKMRILAKYVAEHGADGLETITHMQLDWDLELKDDKNFLGRAGRLETEAKIEKYSALLEASAGTSGVVVTQIDDEIKALIARQAAIGDPGMYVDLPTKLREQQVQQLQGQIGQLQFLRHQAAIEAMKTNPGEDIGALQMRLHMDGGYEGMTPQQRQLAELRDRIAEADFTIHQYDLKNFQAKKALAEAATKYTDFDKLAAAPEYNKRKETGFRSGNAISDVHDKMYYAIDEMRMAFLRSLDQPDTAIAVGTMLNSMLQGQLSMAESAYMQLEEAAIAQVNINKDSVVKSQYADFWADIEENSMDREDRTDWEEVAEEEAEEATRVPVSMALEEPEKAKRHHR